MRPLTCVQVERTEAVSVVELLLSRKCGEKEEEEEEERVAVGFSANDYVIWSLSNATEVRWRDRWRLRVPVRVQVINSIRALLGWLVGCQIARVPCGGWRRPHACLLRPDNPSHFCLVFLKVPIPHSANKTPDSRLETELTALTVCGA